MPINQDKIKATDYLVESLKLIVVITTVFITGLLIFRNQVNSLNKYFFYISIFFWLITLILSIINLNHLINKIYRSEEDAIKQKDTKSAFIYVSITFFIGIFFAIIFLYNIPISTKIGKVQKNQISITNETIMIDGNFSRKIKIIKFKDGSIKEIIIN